MRLFRSESGETGGGFTLPIREDGFNGTAVTISGDGWMKKICDKSNDGKIFAATRGQSGKTACHLTSTAEKSSGRPCSTGLMTAGIYDVVILF